jgi:thioredoxin 1
MRAKVAVAIGNHSFSRANSAPETVRNACCRKAGRLNQEKVMSGNIVNVTDASFEQDVLQSDVPVLVDYWAEWCGPCKMIAPVLEEIADEYSGKLKVCKLNIDENEQTPPKFNIRGIPTLMLFKNGNVDATKVGALSKSQLAAFLDSNL